MSESIKQLQEAIHANAVDKGFWDCTMCDGNGAYAVQPGALGLDWDESTCSTCEGTGRYRNDGESIALIHSELSEALECLRDGTGDRKSQKIETLEESWRERNDGTPIQLEPYETNLAEELADVVIRVMDFAESKGIDLGKAIEWKMEFNQGRPHKHNRRF